MPEPAMSPPYYAVVFSSRRRGGDDGYGATAERMLALAAEQPGFLGVESVRDAEGRGVTISYWTSRQAIRARGQQAEHLLAQRRGRETWYSAFELRICRVEEERRFVAE